MNPEGGGLHIPGLSYVSVDSVQHVNEVISYQHFNDLLLVHYNIIFNGKFIFSVN